MPLVITVMLQCDGCGTIIEPPRQIKQDEIDPLRWKWKRLHVPVERVRRTTKFYCAACADKPHH